MKENKETQFETKAIRTQVDQSTQREHSVPLYMTSSFTFDSAEQARALFADEERGNIYSRFSNPNVDEFVRKMCLLEGADDGYAFASGMAAVFVSMAGLLNQGDHILSSRAVFGSTHQIFSQILPRWGISHSYADASKPEEWAKLIQPNTRIIFVETPSNPGLEILDLEYLGNLAEKHNCILNVDNCFASPYLQNPLKLGAHLSTHSATKYIDGQGRAIGGVVVGDAELLTKIRFFARHSGPSMSPFNAWLFSKSLETLGIRMDRHCQNAMQLAIHLQNHSDVESTIYPFLDSHPSHLLARKQMKAGGGIVSFNINGGVERGRRFLDALDMFSHTANLGDTRTIATHPASTTHSKLSDNERAAVGIESGLIRISVGLEHIDDIIQEMNQAIEKSR